MDLHILKSQANLVFQQITALELDPTNFEWVNTSGWYSQFPASQLNYKGSDYHFQFDNSKMFHSKFSPGSQTVTQWESSTTWIEQFEFVHRWLQGLKREIESPDLWKAISEQAQILESAASSDTSNALFTAEEKAYIVQGIKEIEQFLLTAHKIDPELVEARLNYLIESSERVGRKDWINLLISVLVGIVINAALPPETTRELFRFAGTVLRQIINQPLLLP